MRPAHERLDRPHLAVREHRLGLVVQHQLVLVQGTAELPHDREARVVALVGSDLVEVERRVLPLGAVHRDVGALDQQLGRVAVIGKDRDPDRRLDRERKLLDEDRLLEGGANPFDRREEAVVLGGLRQQQAELVTAESRCGVRRPQCTLQAHAELLEQLVAGPVPERVVDLLEPIEIQHHDREARAVPLCLGDRALDAVVEEQPVRQAGQRIVQRLALAQLGLAHELDLGALALRDVLDHRHGEGRSPVLIALEHGAHLTPDEDAVLPRVARLEPERLALAEHERAEQLLGTLEVLGVDVVAHDHLAELRGGVAEHLLERRVRLDGPAVAAETQDPDRDALEERPEPGQRLRLTASSLELGSVAHRRRQHDGEHLERLAVVLVQPGRLRTAHHVHRPDDLAATEQGNADERRIPDRRSQLLVDAGIVRRILDQQRKSALDRVLRDRALERPARVEDRPGDPADGPGVKHVAVDQVDHRAVRAGDRLRALRDDLHDRLQIASGTADLALRLEDQRKATGSVGVGARHAVCGWIDRNACAL